MAGQVEVRDQYGVTEHYNDTYTTSPTNVPPSAGGLIAEVLIDVVEPEEDDDGDKHLLVSFDNGTTFKRLYIGSHLTWTPKGQIKQLVIKSSSGSIYAEILMNREPS